MNIYQLSILQQILESFFLMQKHSGSFTFLALAVLVLLHHLDRQCRSQWQNVVSAYLYASTLPYVMKQG